MESKLEQFKASAVPMKPYLVFFLASFPQTKLVLARTGRAMKSNMNQCL
jgi:hypothetical protein